MACYCGGIFSPQKSGIESLSRRLVVSGQWSEHKEPPNNEDFHGPHGNAMNKTCRLRWLKWILYALDFCWGFCSFFPFTFIRDYKQAFSYTWQWYKFRWINWTIGLGPYKGCGVSFNWKTPWSSRISYPLDLDHFEPPTNKVAPGQGMTKTGLSRHSPAICWA